MTESLYSNVLAQIFGLYFTLMGILLFTRIEFYRRVVAKLTFEIADTEIILSASLGLLIGLAVLVMHNIWAWEPRVLVTLIAWFVTIKSIIWLAFPEGMLKMIKAIDKGFGYYIVAFIVFAIGIILMSSGFHFHFVR